MADCLKEQVWQPGRPRLDQIEGLKWIKRWRMNNDSTFETESYVVPFPQLEPFNVVFHGDSKFDYGHYGIHLGQEDNLTFLGQLDQLITARFYDARVGSPTAGKMFETTFAPSSGFTLRIPPGVAHGFSGLEKVTTINSYRLFLPAPQDWEELLKVWNPSADVVNFTHEELLAQRPLLKACTERASAEYYKKLASRMNVRGNFDREFPESLRVKTENGERWLRLFQRSGQGGEAQMSHSVAPIPLEGVYWRRKNFVGTGKDSGIVPFADEKPFFVVDHGFTEYSNDTYGIHLGQEDHLTFVGPSEQEFRIDLVDARKESPTWGRRHSIIARPSPWIELVIPSGVAHRFKNLENIFTINQPRYRINSASYRPGLDTLDWDETRMELPKLTPFPVEVSESFYLKIVEHQTRLSERDNDAFSPTGYLTQDRNGARVKLVLRKKATA